MRTITDLRIDALKREIAELKASARLRMHDSLAIGAVAHRLRLLNGELIDLEQHRRVLKTEPFVR